MGEGRKRGEGKGVGKSKKYSSMKTRKINLKIILK